MEFQESNTMRSFKKSLELSVDKILNEYLELNNLSNLSQQELNTIIENITKSKEICYISQKFSDDNELCDLDKYTFILNLEKSDTLNDDVNIESLLYFLNQNPTVEMKCKILKLIHKSPLVDIIEKENWEKLSKVLRECLVSKNHELFLISFKVQIKLSSNSQTINYAYFNLIKTLNSVFQSRRGQTLYFDGINMKTGIQENILKLIDLTLKNLNILHKYHNNYKEKSMESIIHNFMELVAFHIYCEKNDNLNFFNYLSVLDPKAKWLSQLLYNASSRYVVFKFFNENHLFIKFLIFELINTININESELIVKYPNKSELTYEIIKFATFSHCSNIIYQLSCYRKGHELLQTDIKLNERPISLHSLIIIIITAINNLTDLPKQKQKRGVLIEILIKILQNNYNLISDKEIAHTLLKPLYFNISVKNNTVDITKNNFHVFRILSIVSSKKNGFFVMFGFTDRLKTKRYTQNKYNRSISLTEPAVFSAYIEKFSKHHCICSARENDFICPGRLIIDFSTNFFHFCINTNDMTEYVDEILEVLNCCYNIFTIHSYVPNMVNSKKLIAAVKDLCLLSLKLHLTNISNRILKFLCLIGSTSNGLDILKDHLQTFFTICKIYSTTTANLAEDIHLSSLFIKLGQSDTLYLAVLENNEQLIANYLNEIWKLQEDQIIFLSGSDKGIEIKTFEFLTIIFTLSMNYNCVKQLLCNDQEDDVTLVEYDGKPTNLQDLVDDSINTIGPGTLSCYLGLLAIKTLIFNLNTYIYLQLHQNLQEQLLKLQSEYVTNIDETNIQNSEVIIDECSSLRQDILDYIKTIGHVNYKYKEGFRNRNLQSSVTLSARIRHKNELHRFLNDSRNSLHDNAWLLQTRRIYRHICAENIKEYVLVDLIQQVRSGAPNLKLNFYWPSNEKMLNKLFPEDIIAISFIAKFGVHNKLLPSSSQNEENLNLLLRQVYFYLNINRESFDNFDWFVAVVFLICGGNIERCRNVLQCMVHLPVSSFIWTSLGSKTKYRGKSGIQTHFHDVLNVLIDDFEILKCALENANISWSALSKIWINQCFFNVFQWSEIIHYVAVCVLYPAEYVLFILLSIAQHLHYIILKASVTNDLGFYQKLMQLEGFKISDWFPHIEQMAKQYKNILMKF